MVFLTVISFSLCPACKEKSQGANPNVIAEMATKGDALVVDVREAEELSSGMAEPAVWMPMSKINAGSAEWNQLVEKNKDKTIAVYCAVGGRSGDVVSMLKEKGIKAVNLGGFRDWQSAKLPTKAGPPAENR